MKFRYTLSILIILSIVSLFVGVSDVSILDAFQLTPEQIDILLISRFPRLVSILIAGASISICGLIMQQLTRNKFVSPTTAGTFDSARLGVLVSLLVFTSASPLVKMMVAFGFALLGTFIFMQILERIPFKDTIFIPLVGLMFGNVISSISTFFALKYNLVQNMSSWLHGDFSMIMEGRYEMMFISIPFLVIAYLYANQFTIAGVGEDFAKNVGLNYKQVVNIGLAIVAMVTASVVLTVGMIPFLGLIVPNIVTYYYGDHLKKSIIQTAIIGAAFVLACDVLGRVIIYPYEISISVTVGVIGSGIFIYLLMRRRSYAA
ncbi:ABC transporter permease [Halobacillus amylolyticus]|uniref:ABC transporter permease n=1 Tax=Halobacillus amylolyticus TaxID=2932259 RepID=A0ABY4H759_9BACI|nr:ABC transporter permease [Halobacillus amylolyticus]UOR10517.1 ABC transporter permease [Halobacillus amylolyticus]